MFKDAQKEVDTWAQQHKKPYWDSLSQLAALTEEVGEVARVMNHTHGDKVKKPTEDENDLGRELGDVLFALICIANKHEIELDDAFTKSMEKSRTRDKDRFEKK
ncbi:MAG: NTP pyrophosphatase (non-canonical NTP hydrolase) [Candidatus Azotimanducaceae bacterium]|jgi:NTP pyrophosphatase (non-canonical NTP hydrolase)